MTIILKRKYEKNYTTSELRFIVNKEADNEFLSGYKNDTKTMLNENIIRTLELPYNNNKKNISCIDSGNYILRIHNSPSRGECIKVYSFNNNNYWKIKERKNELIQEAIVLDELEEVKGRSNILIHSGNTVQDFTYNNFKYKKEGKGCILVGLKLEKVIDEEFKKQAILRESKKALQILIDYIKTNNGIDELIIE